MNVSVYEVSTAGIWCGSGIVRAKKALLAIPGVTAVKMDLPRSMARVEGDFDRAAVDAAIGAIVRDAEAKLDAANRCRSKG